MGFKVIDPQPVTPPKVSDKRKTRSGKQRKRRWRRWVVGSLSIPIVAIIGIGSMEAINHEQVKNASAQTQLQGLKKHADIAGDSELVVNQDKLDYGSNNHNIPNAKELKEYQKSSAEIYGRGYIAIPKQPGVSQPIPSLIINEGASDKVLAYGAGTPRPNEKMGEGNFALAAHNFGNNVTYFSPMQKGIDVNQQPKAYLTDGKNIYTYQFNRVNDVVMSGRKVVDFRQGQVLDDSVANGAAVLTLITCDEPGVFTLTPQNRLLLRAHLVDIENADQADSQEKALFPQVFY